jgi:hypothetical protein
MRFETNVKQREPTKGEPREPREPREPAKGARGFGPMTPQTRADRSPSSIAEESQTEPAQNHWGEWEGGSSNGAGEWRWAEPTETNECSPAYSQTRSIGGDDIFRSHEALGK